MTAPKHTPGPWVLESAETYTVRAPDEGAICQLKWLRGRHGMGGRRSDDEVMANARLIAAAPDMLAALRLVIDNEHRRLTGGAANEPTLREVIEGLDAGRAAIAKAEGGGK